MFTAIEIKKRPACNTRKQHSATIRRQFHG